ncbi:MAG: amidohydrolase, partial [Gammaproteobacteria bacterium]|nr:amidohydrolase [Gammaproteobacteria bacterium]
MIRTKLLTIFAMSLLPFGQAFAQNNDSILDFIDGRYEDTAKLARTIWEYAEVGYQETRSSTLLQETLSGEG